MGMEIGWINWNILVFAGGDCLNLCKALGHHYRISPINFWSV
jgi:hypothetical protein